MISNLIPLSLIDNSSFSVNKIGTPCFFYWKKTQIPFFTTFLLIKLRNIVTLFYFLFRYTSVKQLCFEPKYISVSIFISRHHPCFCCHQPDYWFTKGRRKDIPFFRFNWCLCRHLLSLIPSYNFWNTPPIGNPSGIFFLSN